MHRKHHNIDKSFMLQKCAFSSAKKWHFERPNLRTESKNLAKHPPKWLGRHLGHAFPFLGEYRANFFWPLKGQKTKTAGRHSFMGL